MVEAVEKLIAEITELFYTPQNAAEFWNVCTRPVERNGISLDIAEADRRLRLIDQQFLLLPDSEAAYREWRRIVVEYSVSGIQVHDARLAAVMYVHRISHLLTLNPRDFVRYPGLTVVRPQDLQAQP